MKESEIASFIEKLDEILQCQQYSQIIRWTPQGDAFLITSVTRLTDTVLPRYFKHNNYSSFNRQLNMYHFVKIRCETDQIYYQNPHFLRYDKDQYKYIKRRVKNQNQDGQYPLSAYNREQGALAELKEIGDRQYKLENMCKGIFTENQTIIDENARLWKKINQKLDRKSKQLSALLYLLLLRSENKQIVQYLPLLESYEPIGEESDNNHSESSDNEDIIEHNPSRTFPKSILSLMENKNINPQDIIKFLIDDEAKSKLKAKPLSKSLSKSMGPQAPTSAEDPNLYIKQNGESCYSTQENEKETSFISDMNYFLSNDRQANKDALFDFNLDI